MKEVGVRRSGVAALPLATVALLTLATVEFILVIDEASLAWPGLVFAGVGVEYLLVGVLTWSRRPANRTGALLCFCGFSVLVSGLQNVTQPALVGIGLLLSQWPIAVLIHLVLAFPSGRLPDRRSRWLLAGGYLITVVLPAFDQLFAAVGRVPEWLRLGSRPGLVAGIDGGQRIAAVVVIIAVALVLALRVRRVRSVQLPGLVGVSAYGVLTLLFLDLSANLVRLLGLSPLVKFAAQVTVFAGVPVVFAVMIIRGGYARAGGVQRLAEWLGTAHDQRISLTAALADALGDPSVQLVYWLPESGREVDASGAPATLRSGPDRGLVEVELAGERLGSIGYDRTLTADSDQVEAAGRVVALAMDRERLVAELRAGRAALQDSLIRIVEAGDRERRRVARDLHDGLQGQLVVLAVRAGRLAADPAADPRSASDAAALRTDTERAIATLRDLVHDIIPALLVDRGLYAATEDLVDRLPVLASLDLPEQQDRLPAPIETAGYFTVAELVANAVKHAEASELTVRIAGGGTELRIEVSDNGVGGAALDRGTGLRGVADRIEAIGGSLRLVSPPGGGTTVVAEVPCAS